MKKLNPCYILVRKIFNKKSNMLKNGMHYGNYRQKSFSFFILVVEIKKKT